MGHRYPDGDSLYLEGGVVWFIIQVHNQFAPSISSLRSKYDTLCSDKFVSLRVSADG